MNMSQQYPFLILLEARNDPPFLLSSFVIWLLYICSNTQGKWVKNRIFVLLFLRPTSKIKPRSQVTFQGRRYLNFNRTVNNENRTLVDQ